MHMHPFFKDKNRAVLHSEMIKHFCC